MDREPEEDEAQWAEQGLEEQQQRRSSVNISAVLIGAGSAAVVLYALLHREWREFLSNGGLVLTAITCIFGLVVAMERVEAPGVRQPPTPWRERLRGLPDVAFFAGLLVVVAVVLYSAGVGLADGASWAFSHFLQLPDTSRSATVAAAATLLLGAVFFAFRIRFRVFYGLSEVAVGLTVASHRIASESTPDSLTLYFAVLTAGVYLVVRGFDNMHQGWNLDPAWQWVRRRGRRRMR